MARWHAPIDPNCPAVRRFTKALFDDPMTAAYGAPTDDILADFERSHRAKCPRCQAFGAANMEITD